jgi:hypothetical protein
MDEQELDYESNELEDLDIDPDALPPRRWKILPSLYRDVNEFNVPENF